MPLIRQVCLHDMEGIKMPKVSDLIDILGNDFDPGETIAYSIWTSRDVENLNEQENRIRRLQDEPEIEIEQEDIDDILEYMHDSNDKDIGLNNDTLLSAYIEILGNKETEEEELEIL
jgi:hypothetical protein